MLQPNIKSFERVLELKKMSSSLESYISQNVHLSWENIQTEMLHQLQVAGPVQIGFSIASVNKGRRVT